jgi:hypothetical protein
MYFVYICIQLAYIYICLFIYNVCVVCVFYVRMCVHMNVFVFMYICCAFVRTFL